MNRAASARTAARRARRLVLALLAVLVAAIIGTLGYQSVPSAATSFGTAPHGDHQSAFGEADGAVPNDMLTVFDAQAPAVAKLDPSLLKALRQATTDAADGGVTIYINSGWRSPAYQNQLLREAVSKYRSEKKAARWVATPDTSAGEKHE